MKIVSVEVKITMLEDADVDEVVSDCDYSFKHPSIVETEIMGYDEKPSSERPQDSSDAPIT